jgi:hypothetical protein
MLSLSSKAGCLNPKGNSQSINRKKRIELEMWFMQLKILPRKHEALSSNPSTAKRKKRTERKKEEKNITALFAMISCHHFTMYFCGIL